MEIEVEGAEEVAQALEIEEKEYKRRAGRLLTREGNKLKTEVRRQILASPVKIKTGNYLNSVTRQKNYKYHLENPGKAKDSSKVYGKRKGGVIKAGGRGFGPEIEGRTESTAKRYNGRVRFLQTHKYSAPHTHLLEYGHRVVVHGSDTGKKTRAFENYRIARENYQSRWEQACDNFADELVRDFGK
ncbi:MAG: hypothetical protein LIO87_03160 [Eubacterium sp.]|nr:hypothetical protein [Eubacterium sp.]